MRRWSVIVRSRTLDIKTEGWDKPSSAVTEDQTTKCLFLLLVNVSPGTADERFVLCTASIRLFSAAWRRSHSQYYGCSLYGSATDATGGNFQTIGRRVISWTSHCQTRRFEPQPLPDTFYITLALTCTLSARFFLLIISLPVEATN